MRKVIVLVGLLLAAPALAEGTAIHVPFVGCHSDGQLGPRNAPRNHSTPALPASLARDLAYYSAEDGPGTLAPRGWQCVGLYGSNGSFLVVTPAAHQASEFLRDKPAAITGPAIQATVSIGETSGRFDVAEAVSRYFPIATAFARSVEAEGLEGPFKHSPYSTDIIRNHTERTIRLTTPARRSGAGTDTRLAPGPLPIESEYVLIGDLGAPSLLSRHVRLPANQARLANVILDEKSAGE